MSLSSRIIFQFTNKSHTNRIIW